MNPSPLSAFVVRLFALIRKELLAVLKDPANRAILMGPVIVQSLLFGYVATYDLNNVPYALLDESHSVTSARFVADLDGTGVFDRVAVLTSPREIAEVVDSGKALMVLHIAADFERRVLTGEAASVQVILDGRNSTTAASASAYVGTAVAEFNTARRQRCG